MNRKFLVFGLFLLALIGACGFMLPACRANAEAPRDPNAWPRHYRSPNANNISVDRIYDRDNGIICYVVDKWSTKSGAGISCVKVQP